MSKKVVFISIGEINGIRITCQKCGIALTIPRLGYEPPKGESNSWDLCPACKEVIFQEGALRNLLMHMEDFFKAKDCQPYFEIVTE